MLGWKAKIRAILPPNHDLPSQTKLFMKKLDETLKQMTSVDPLIHLLPLENNTDDIPAGKIVKLLSGNQAAYIKIKEVPKKKYMDAFLHFKSQSNYSKIKLQILPWFLQEKRIYIDEYKWKDIDEYKLESLDDVQVGWLFGKSSFVVSESGTKKWLVEDLLGSDIRSKMDFQVRSQGTNLRNLE